MDAVRAALGERRISFYGVSYGTYLGEVYTAMFPARTDRVVLDGVHDPSRRSDSFAQDHSQVCRATLTLPITVSRPVRKSLPSREHDRLPAGVVMLRAVVHVASSC